MEPISFLLSTFKISDIFKVYKSGMQGICTPFGDGGGIFASVASFC